MPDTAKQSNVSVSLIPLHVCVECLFVGVVRDWQPLGEVGKHTSKSQNYTISNIPEEHSRIQRYRTANIWRSTQLDELILDICQ